MKNNVVIVNILTGVLLGAFFVHCHVSNTHHHANCPALHEAIIPFSQSVHQSLHCSLLLRITRARITSLLPVGMTETIEPSPYMQHVTVKSEERV